MEPVSQF